MRGVVGDDAEQRRIELPFAARATEHHQRQVMRRDHGAWRERADVIGERTIEEVVEAEPQRLERVAASIGCKVHLSVELGRRALPGEMRRDVGLAGPSRGVAKASTTSTERPRARAASAVASAADL